MKYLAILLLSLSTIACDMVELDEALRAAEFERILTPEERQRLLDEFTCVTDESGVSCIPK